MPDDTPATPATTTVTEDNAYDISKFTKAPFVASYGGTILGGTEGPISITPEFEYEDVSCNQAGGQSIVKILKSIKYRISGTFFSCVSPAGCGRLRRSRISDRNPCRVPGSARDIRRKAPHRTAKRP